MTDPQDDLKHVAELVDRARIAMLTTMTREGKHESRPMALQEVEFDGDLWFFVDRNSDVAADVSENPQVNVAFSNDKNSEWTSIAGSASVLFDRAKAEELWSPAIKVWFPDGPDSPDLALLRVRAESAQYWESPGGKVRQLIGAARAVVTRNPDAFPGETHEVSL